MADKTLAIGEVVALTGVQARTLRHWIKKKLLPKPLGKGRGARYLDDHVLRARAIRALRMRHARLNEIRQQLSQLGEEQLRALSPPADAPAVAALAENVSRPPPEPTYPSETWEVVVLMDGLSLMVSPARGAALRRIADEIYRYYGRPRPT